MGEEHPLCHKGEGWESGPAHMEYPLEVWVQEEPLHSFWETQLYSQMTLRPLAPEMMDLYFQLEVGVEKRIAHPS